MESPARSFDKVSSVLALSRRPSVVVADRLNWERARAENSDSSELCMVLPLR